MSQQAYIPSLTFHRLTPLYDTVLSRLFPETEIKRKLVARAAAPEQKVLDLGCGTGTLAVMLRQAQPSGQIAGVDIDGAMLWRAQNKAYDAGVALALIQGSATMVPLADNHFDAVMTSLVLHHLDRVQKVAALREAHRVLRPGGRLFMADFGPPNTVGASIASHFTRRLEETADNLAGLVPQLMAEAGYQLIHEFGTVVTFMGTVVLLEGTKRNTA